jgi:S1-C subfamily serine protease
VILTNYHVVQCAVRVRVVFTDDREPVEGTIVGAVPERDLAVVQAEAEGLEALPLGSSEELRLGDDVIAIGFPLGLGGPTVTRGILSGEDRNIEAQTADGEVESLQGLLQTDAAINPGNSGGALIDRAGRLIGINTAVAGQAENIGFAIAIDRALPVIEEILDEPAARQAWLGVSLGSVATDFEALDLNLPSDTRGALVAAVFGGSPADDAGLPEGGVVVEANGEPTESAEDLIAILRDLDPGDRVDLTLVTPTGRDSVTATLTQRPLPDELEERC